MNWKLLELLVFNSFHMNSNLRFPRHYITVKQPPPQNTYLAGDCRKVDILFSTKSSFILIVGTIDRVSFLKYLFIFAVASP